MIRRMRLRAPVYTSAILLLVGIALAAQATEPVTRSQMESFVYIVVAGAGTAIIAAFWLLLTSFISRLEKMVDAAVGRMDERVAGYFSALASHDNSPYSHGPASEHNHGPINGRLKAVEDDIAQFVKDCLEHRLGCPNCGPRDPKEGPPEKHHRKGDSGDNYTALRGKNEEV